MANVQLSVGNTLSTAYEISKKHGLLIAVALLGVSIISYLVQTAFSFGSGLSQSDIAERSKQIGEQLGRGDTGAIGDYFDLMGEASNPFASILGSLVSFILGIFIINLTMGLVSGRYQSFTIDAIKLPVITYVKTYVVQLLVGVICLLGFLLCIIPGVYLGCRLSYATYAIIDEPDLDIIAAIKKSWAMTSDNILPVFLLTLACFGIMIAGLMCCCVGYFYAAAIVYFAAAVSYFVLKPNAE